MNCEGRQLHKLARFLFLGGLKLIAPSTFGIGIQTLNAI